MIFIVFDIEIIFFYPWAVAHAEVGLFGLVAMLIFTVAVFESFVYLIGNGALDWGPVKQLRSIRSRCVSETAPPRPRSVASGSRVGRR